MRALFALLLALFTAPLFAAPHDIAEPQNGPARTESPKVIVVGGGFLVAWLDASADGVRQLTILPIDTSGRRLSEPRTVFATRSQGNAEILGFGTTFGLFLERQEELEYTHFTADGHVLGTVTLPIPGASMSIAADDEAICVVSSQMLAHGSFPIATSVFDLDGHLRSRSTETVGPDVNWYTVQSDGGGEFVIALMHRRAVGVRRLDHAGTLIETSRIDTPGMDYPSMVAHHDGALIYSDSGNTITGFVMTRGERSQPRELAHYGSDSPPFVVAPYFEIIATGGSSYAILYVVEGAQERFIRAATVGPDGASTAATLAEVPFRTVWVGPTAAIGSAVFATFSQYDGADEIQTGGLVQIPFDLEPLATGPANQITPRVVNAGNGFLATWVDDIPWAPTVRAALLDRSGRRIAPAFRLFTGSSFWRYDPIHLATNGSIHVAVWEANDKILALRFRDDGTVLDAAPIVVGTGVLPEVASDGRDFLVLWSLSSNPELGVAGVAAATGLVTRAAAPVPPVVDDAIAARGLAWDGSAYVAGYQTGGWCGRLKPCTPYSAATIRLSANGTPQGAPTTILPGGHLLAVVSNGKGETLSIGWRDGKALGIFQRGAGARSAPFPIFTWPYDHRASAAFDGADYLVTMSPYAAGETDLVVARVRSNGTAQLEGALRRTAGGDVAAHDGSAIVVTSEARAGSPYIHAEAYMPDDLPPAPAPPATPYDVRLFGKNPGVVTWSGGDGATSLVVEERIDGVWHKVVPNDSRRIIEQKACVVIVDGGAEAVRIRLMNAGGVSEPSADVIPEPKRRRPAG